MTEILPAGRHYAVTWGIPDAYGGMTSAMLHRCRAFVRIAQTPVTIVTYEFRDDYDVVRQRLVDRSELIDGISLINLWEDLRTSDDDTLRRLARSCTEKSSTSFAAPAPLTAPALRVEHRGKGTVTRVDYYRDDGTLLVSDRRDVADGSKPRSVTVCDTTGRPLGTWRSVWGLYRAWLDSLPRDPVAWFIVDSKTSANHVVTYRRPDVVTMHLVHGSHLAAGEGPLGRLTKARVQSIEQHASWDALVLLTQHQLADLEARYGPAPNRHVVPNGRDRSAGSPPMERDPRRGIVVASLTRRKRVSHAIKAAAQASRGRPWGRFRPRPITLDVVGDGPSRSALELLARRNRRHVDTRFHGHVDDVPDRLRRASFSLLTSTNEGQPLAVIESMAAGCIPVSYDIRYGPADIITDGVDGFLVPDADLDGMAETINRLVAMVPADLEAMRRAALARSHDFDDTVITRRWGDVMRSAREVKSSTKT
ncbi:glycosyl transferase group 1 [Xylanimonas cellulosilytica DSM 15894]|uniref:Glycosyl transferase group 1 n=1 Tax=Xylanimonas cellulosilytica (strain DSM 15894 / JCM 12276 / CECT 5975 / KCTC 9989 / LMG 20990 / NBRC 107835 / XIL07) TaxID=446471 RepID=D1BX37_XYLCX|nr:glycosyltransferase [Xylanimonas cellulosilytica]ACZ31605.1 glycosyl transferase group 1 [Xylanimonas cellulosilytica DSM 15894]